MVGRSSELGIKRVLDSTKTGFNLVSASAKTGLKLMLDFSNPMFKPDSGLSEYECVSSKNGDGLVTIFSNPETSYSRNK